MEVQLQIKQNALEVQEYMKDLFEWEASMKKKTAVQQQNVSTAQEAAPAPRGRATNVVGAAPADLQQLPFDPKTGKPTRPARSQQPSSQSKEAKHAAAHTYDHWKKWDKLDVDKLLDSDEEDGGRLASSTQSNGQASSLPQRNPSDPIPIPARPPPAAQRAPPSQVSAASKDSSLPPIRSQEPQTAEAWRTRGNDLFKVAEYSGAKECYSRSLALEPSAAAYANRAMAELKLKEWGAAEEDCSEAVAVDPKYTKAWHRRGQARRELGRMLEAAEDFESALRLEPTNKASQADRDACLQAYMRANKLQPPATRVPVAVLPLPAATAVDAVSGTGRSQQQGVQQPAAPSVSATVVPVSPGDVGVNDSAPSAAAASASATGAATNAGAAAAATSPRGASSSRSTGGSSKDLSSVAAAAAAQLTNKVLQSGFKVPKTSTEFEATWRGLKGDLQLQASYLQQLQPSQLPGVFKSSLTAPMLQSILTALLTAVGASGAEGSDSTPQGGQLDAVFANQVLQQLSCVDRFDMTVMSIPGKERASLKQLWSKARPGMEAAGVGVAELDVVGKKYRLV